MRLMAQAALSGYWEREMVVSVYAASMEPWAKAPTTNTAGLSSGTLSIAHLCMGTSGALLEKPMRGASPGRYFVTGPLMTLRSCGAPRRGRE